MWTLSGFIDEISADPQEQAAVAAGLGLRYAEVRSAWGVNVLDLGDDQLSRLLRILAEHGLDVSSVGSPIGKIFIDEDFDPHLDRMRHAAEVARRLHAPYIRIFSFWLRPGADPAAHRDEVLRRMRALADLAEQAEVICCTRTRVTSTVTSRSVAWTWWSPSVRRACGWPGIPPTSSRSGSGPGPTGTGCCARTWSTCRSRMR